MRKINSSRGTLAALLLGSALVMGACSKSDDNGGGGESTGGTKATGGKTGSGGSGSGGSTGSGGSGSGGSTGSGGSASGGSTGSGGSASGGSTGSGGSSGDGSAGSGGSGDASASGGATGSGGGSGDAAADTGGGGATFAQVVTILKMKCAACHNANHASMFALNGTDAAIYTALTADATGAMCTGKGKRVKAGDSAGSILYDKVAKATPICGAQMPRGAAPLAQKDLDTIKAWIDAGAKM